MVKIRRPPVNFASTKRKAMEAKHEQGALSDDLFEPVCMKSDIVAPVLFCLKFDSINVRVLRPTPGRGGVEEAEADAGLQFQYYVAGYCGETQEAARAPYAAARCARISMGSIWIWRFPKFD